MDEATRLLIIHSPHVRVAIEEELTTLILMKASDIELSDLFNGPYQRRQESSFNLVKRVVIA